MMVDMGENLDRIIGVPIPTAARVIGVSDLRLIDWADRELLVPETQQRFGQNNRRVWAYSFEDLVLGRLIRVLEDSHGVHIRQITSIISAVRSWAGPETLTSLSWAVEGGEVFVQFSDGAWHGSRRPSQSVEPGTLNLEQIRADTRVRLQRPAEASGRTSRRRGVLGSKEVFEGTRIPVATIVGYLEHGFDDDRILTSFPDLSPADIEVARGRLAAA